MAFPDIRLFKDVRPGGYERQMGTEISELLKVFADRVPDPESHTCVSNLVASPAHWGAGHAVFDEVRRRLLSVQYEGTPQTYQYLFEEECCKAVFNATRPDGPFDPSSGYWVVPFALKLAGKLGMPLESITSLYLK